MSNRTTQLALALSLLCAVGLSGVVVGVAVDRMWLIPGGGHRGPPRGPGGPHGPPSELLEDLKKELSLTEAQSQVVGEALEEARRQNKALMEGVRPQMQQAFLVARQKVQAVLSAEQFKRFEELAPPMDAPPPGGPPRGPPFGHRRGPPPDGPPPDGPPGFPPPP